MSFWLSIILVVMAFISGQSRADSWQQAGSARISTEYDTNPAMNPTYQVGIWRSRFNPSYQLKRTSKTHELSAEATLQIARTSNKTLSQDRNDPSVSLNGLWQNDTGEFGLTAKYFKVSTRIVEIDNTGPFFADGTSASRMMLGSWSKALSEHSTLSADGSYSDVSYTGGTFVDYVNRSGGTMFDYAWSERNATFLRMSYADTNPAGNTPLSRFANVILGWNWKVSDSLEGSLQAGEFKISGARLSKQAAATVRYTTGQQTQLALNANRQITPSGLGGFVTIDQANGSWSYALNDRSNAGIDLNWSKNHSFANIINRTAGAWLQFDISSYFVTRAYYQHRTSEQGGVGAATSDMLGLSVVYTHTDF